MTAASAKHQLGLGGFDTAILHQVLLEIGLRGNPAFPCTIRTGDIDFASRAVHRYVKGLAFAVQRWGHHAAAHGLPVAPVHLEWAVRAPCRGFGRHCLGWSCLGWSRFFRSCLRDSRFDLNRLGLNLLGLNRLGRLARRCSENGLCFWRAAGLQRCADQFGGTGIPQHQLGPNRHLVGVIDGVEINQRGHGNLIGASDLGEGLTSGHGVRGGAWIGFDRRGLGLRDWLWFGKHGRGGQLQRLAKFNMIGALKAIDGDQIP